MTDDIYVSDTDSTQHSADEKTVMSSTSTASTSTLVSIADDDEEEIVDDTPALLHENIQPSIRPLTLDSAR